MTNSENGVIMMETLIMLPVYLVILAGVFWLGELCLIRQTLNTAERLRFWEDGCRYSSSPIAGTNIFSAFCETPSAMQVTSRQDVVTGVGNFAARHTINGSSTDGFSSVNTSNGWGTIKQGFVSMNTRRSEWSWGIVDFSRSRLWSGWGTNAEQSKIASGRDEMSMVARGDSNGNPQESMMLFRIDTGSRTNLNFNGSTCWHNVFAETWGSADEEFIKPSVTDSSAPVSVSAYGARNSNYRDWSE